MKSATSIVENGAVNGSTLSTTNHTAQSLAIINCREDKAVDRGCQIEDRLTRAGLTSRIRTGVAGCKR